MAPAIANDGTLTFTPADDAFGTATITVKATDDGNTGTAGDKNESDEVTFTITIDPVNDAPSFDGGDDVTVDEDTLQKVVAQWATDILAGPDNESDQTVSFNVVADDTSLFSVQPAIDASGELTFTPAPNAFGDTVVSVTAVDNGNSDPLTMGDDNESDAQAFLITIDPAIDTAGELTFTPAANAFGSTIVTVTLVDDGDTDKALDDNTGVAKTFTITVDPVNDVPVAEPQSLSTDEENVKSVTLSGTDVETTDPANLSYSVSNPINGELFTVADVKIENFPAVLVGRVVKFKPSADFNGSASFDFTVTDRGDPDNCSGSAPACDAAETSAAATVSITVDPVNDAPSFSLGSVPNIYEDTIPASKTRVVTSFSPGPPNESDQDVSFVVTNIVSDNLYYPALFDSLAIDDVGDLSFVLAKDAWGTATVTVKAVDDGNSDSPNDGDTNESATQQFTINVLPVNDAPFIGVAVPSASVLEVVDYSDAITSVVVDYGDIDTVVNANNVTTSYTYVPASGSTATAPVTGLPQGLKFVSLAPPLNLAAKGKMELRGRMMVPAGTYSISVVIDDDDDDTFPGAKSATTVLTYTVDYEDVDPTYRGDLSVSTASPTVTTASVLLRTLLDQKDAVNPGSYLEDPTDPVRVRWEISSNTNTAATPLIYPPAGQPAVAVSAEGWAQLQVQLPSGSYLVVAKVESGHPYWRGSVLTQQNLVVALGSTARRVNAGGWLTDPQSANRKGSFSVSVAPQRNGTIQGSASYSYIDASGFTWQVEATSWDPGALTFYPDLNRATLRGRAIAKKINARGKVVATFTNWFIDISFYDGTSLRRVDQFGIVITMADGTSRVVPVAANVFNGESLSNIGGGNITVFR